eukprot:jgi/Chlat1/3345/Chrsp23S03655
MRRMGQQRRVQPHMHRSRGKTRPLHSRMSGCAITRQSDPSRYSLIRGIPTG